MRFLRGAKSDATSRELPVVHLVEVHAAVMLDVVVIKVTYRH